MALSRDAVVDAALELVDERGVDAVTLRAVASAVGVQAPTLYWHIRDKAALMDALADRIMAGAVDHLATAAELSDAREWLFAASIALRTALCAHRDGARIVAASRDALGRAQYSDAAMAALVDRGVALADARLRVLAAERFTMGYVLEEQAPAPTHPGPDLEEMTRRFPTATRAIRDYFTSGHTAEDVFPDVLRIVVGVDGR